MSNEVVKARASRRIHQTEKHIARQLRIAKQKGYDFNDEVMRQPHRLAKHHVMDCGNPGCSMCSNPRKLFGDRTIQERRFYQEYKEDGQDGNAADC